MSGVGVGSGFETAVMDVVYECFQPIGEAGRMDAKVSFLISSTPRAVVDVDIDISGILKAFG